MNCKQVEELLPLYAGRDLQEKRATLVTEHVQTCAACARVADEYRDSIRLTEQFAPPVFSEAVYTDIRQRVLREIETEATAPAAFASLLPRLTWARLTWATASVVLMVASLFAIYFTVNRGNDEQLADKPPAKVQPETKQADLPRTANTGGPKQQVAGVPQSGKRSRRVGPTWSVHSELGPKRRQVAALQGEAQTSRDANTVEARSSDTTGDSSQRDSAALLKTLRVEIQTKDPKIKIIWFVPQENKPVIPSSKGT